MINQENKKAKQAYVIKLVMLGATEPGSLQQVEVSSNGLLSIDKRSPDPAASE